MNGDDEYLLVFEVRRQSAVPDGSGSCGEDVYCVDEEDEEEGEEEGFEAQVATPGFSGEERHFGGLREWFREVEAW